MHAVALHSDPVLSEGCVSSAVPTHLLSPQEYATWALSECHDTVPWARAKSSLLQKFSFKNCMKINNTQSLEQAPQGSHHGTKPVKSSRAI